MDNVLLVKDINGNKVAVYSHDLFNSLQEDTMTLLGMDLPTIKALRDQYLRRGGILGMQTEMVKEIFK